MSSTSKIQALNFMIECLEEFQAEDKYNIDSNYGASVLNNINYFENVDDVIYYFEKPWKFIDEINVAIFSLLVEDRKMNLDYFENKELLNEIENLIILMQVDFPTINKQNIYDIIYDPRNVY